MLRYAMPSLSLSLTPKPMIPRSPRCINATPHPLNVTQEIERITALYMAAKDELVYAQESQGSVYYHEDKMTADEAVRECLEAYSVLLAKSGKEAEQVRTKIGTKMNKLQKAWEALPMENA
ncbi:hypothetical protein BZG36_03147 [Bifiguratus adelaidae]|uniref:Uncharacterized protein n=1 Tax=Bifiguratus adelaidae TaxID=1938954 RepID=A0A261XXC3_9FUNG|nr:hypothetical protein BZG36_03147 [Bifiguratus adelaidae]